MLNYNTYKPSCTYSNNAIWNTPLCEDYRQQKNKLRLNM